MDRESFLREVFEGYHRPVYRFFEHRGFTGGECEDLTQEVFLRIYRGSGELRRPSRLGAWIFQVSANVYRQELRRRAALKRSVREVALPIEDDLEIFEGGEPDPLRRTLSRERVVLLEKALAELSPQMRRCVLLRGYQELSYEEIASALRVSVQTVKVHLHRARRRLKEELGDFDL